MDVFALGLEDLGLDDPQSTEMVENVRMLNERVDEITKTGMMDREQARRLIEEHAVPINTDRYPLVSFTEQPSRTNVTVTLESAHGGMNDKLRALLEKAVALFRKVLAWMRDRLTDIVQHLAGDKDKRKRVYDAAPGIRNVFSKYDDMAGRAARANAGTEETRKKHDELQVKYDSRVQSLASMLNQYHAQTLYRSALSSAVFWLGTAEGQILQAVEERLKLFQSTIDRLASAPSSADGQSALAELSKPFAPSWLKHGLSGVELGDAESFGKMIQAVKRHVDEARNQPATNLSPVEVSAGVMRLGAKFAGDVGWSPQRIIAASSKLDAQAGKLFSTLSSVGGNNVSTATLAQAQLNDISTGLSQLVSLLVTNRRTLNQLSNYLASSTRALYTFMDVSSTPNAKTTTNARIQDELRAYRNEIEKVYAVVTGEDDTPLISDN